MLVKPGITGWAQIHQAYAETVEETAIKLEYDLYYIEHASIMMDILIMLRTITSVLGFKGR
jgi:lipopolysaccharide/colanic/teichoic acid biosynthesis glycosyltransferase